MIAELKHLVTSLPVTLGTIALVTSTSLIVGFKPSILRGRLAMHRNCVIHRGQIWRMMTFHFLHIDLRHLCINMLSFYFVSSAIERMYNRPADLVIFYILLTALAGVVYVAFDWNPVSEFTLGFSVFVYCLIGIIAFRTGKPDLSYISLVAVGCLIDILILNSGYRIDHKGHFTGFLTGCAVGGLGLASVLFSTPGKL